MGCDGGVSCGEAIEAEPEIPTTSPTSECPPSLHSARISQVHCFRWGGVVDGI